MHDQADLNTSIPKADLLSADKAARSRCVDYKKLRLIDVGVLIVPAIIACLVWIAAHRALNSLNLPSPGGLLAIINIAFYALAMWWVYRRRYRLYLYAALRDQGHNVCPKCGYLRQGLEDPAPCPECAAPIESPSG